MSKLYAIIDCNNFYVSCERVFNPLIENKPVVVLSNNDGCAISRSNEAKDLGINMGEPYFKIAKLIEEHKISVFSSNYTLYADMSARVMSVLSKFSPHVEIYSVDECFMRIDGFEHLGVINYAKEIRSTVMNWTGIPVSIGIAKTKTLAKLANFIAKKNPICGGVYFFEDKDQTNNVLSKIDIDEVWGIGKQYSKMLKSNNINTAYDFMNMDNKWIKSNMNVLGLKTAYELKGISCIELSEQNAPKKAIAVTRSFSSKLTTDDDLREAIVQFATRACEKLRHQGMQTKYLKVFIRTNYFSPKDLQYSNYQGISLPYPTDYTPDIIKYATVALSKIYREGYMYKKAGIMLTDFSSKSDLKKDILDNRNHKRDTNLMRTLDKINNIYGSRSIFFAGSGIKQQWLPLSQMKSQSFSTCWNDILKIN